MGRVLVVSARMGAGHDGAARELCQRLETSGIEAHQVDFLDASPGVGRLMKAVYEAWLAWTPWVYEATYRVWFVGPLLCAPLAAVLTLVFGHRIRRWAGEFEASAVVSTYPLASVVLGRLRRRRWRPLRVPAITFITDFAVHPLWVHRGVDLNLCVDRSSARDAAAATGRPARAPGPLVDERFRVDRRSGDAVRQRLGMPAGARVALLVAGSWGVGDLAATFDTLVESGRYFPVAVCGHNDRLRRQLSARGVGLVLGWTDAMPSLMAAADVLVQNAGGLTCMEAFATGLPVVTFRPIPGHGRRNAEKMDRAGVALFAAGPADLLRALDRVTDERELLTGRARALFRGDAALDVRDLALASRPLPVPASRPVVRRLANVGAAAITVYAGLNVGAAAATAAGVGTARSPAAARGDVVLAVRLGPENVGDPALAALLGRDHVGAVVEGRLARKDAPAVAELAAAGASIANGGWGPQSDLHLMAPDDNVTRSARAIAAATGASSRWYVPGPEANAFDRIFANASREVVVRSMQIPLVPRHTVRYWSGRVYVVDAEAGTGAQVERRVLALERSLRRARYHPVPFSDLKQ